ncbi:MAG: hypothetical protein J7M08_04730 [Planctomycetes bacterium]|nr:hypothetical protein [Planctomycetota bacterium]
MSVADYLKGIDEVIKRDDIRGIYGKALNRDFAYSLGLLLAEGFTRAAAVWPVNVVIGHDMRLSGSVLAEGLRQGLEDGGCRPIMMGLAGTEQVGFLVARYSDVIDGGVIITASHNPRAYNGFKFFGRGGKPLSLALAEGPAPPVGEMERIARGLKKRSLPPRLDWDEFAPDYIKTIVQRGGIELERFRNVELGIAVEAGNGMGGRIIQQFAAMTPQLRWTFSNAVPDGNFPVVVPNPLQADYQRMLADVVERSGSDVGICFDGDADRVALMDEKRRMLSPPLLTTLVGQKLRRKLGPDVKIGFNLASSWVIADTFGDRNSVLGGGGAVMTPVGYGKIKPIMYEDPRIALGAEHSGHYMFRDFWCGDSGMMAGLLALELVAELVAEGRTLSSELEGPRSKYLSSGEINFQLPAERSADQTIQEATTRFADEIDRMYVVVDDRVRLVDSYPPEGVELSVADVRVESEQWWFCMRKSGTEGAGGGILRLYVEAFGDRDLMESRRDALIRMVGPELRI